MLRKFFRVKNSCNEVCFDVICIIFFASIMDTSPAVITLHCNIISPYSRDVFCKVLYISRNAILISLLVTWNILKTKQNTKIWGY